MFCHRSSGSIIFCQQQRHLVHLMSLNKINLSLSHSLPYSVNGRPTEKPIFNPFVSVRRRFVSVVYSAMSVSHSANALLVRRDPFNPVESFVHVQNAERTPPEKGARWMYGSYALACGLFGTRAFLVLYLFSSHPWCSVDLIRGRTTTWHATGQTEVFRTLTACSAAITEKERMETDELGCETVVHGTN